MTERHLYVGLDVGTTKVCTIIGTTGIDNQLEIIGVGSHPSYGLKKGCVINIDKTIRSIQASLEEAKMMAGSNVLRACIGIAGNHVYSFNSSGVVPIKGKEITESDVERVIEAAKAVVLPSERDVLHVIPQEFRVDNISGIKNPIGMSGVRLEAHVHIVTGLTSMIQNLVKCVESTGLVVDNIVLQPVASSRAVLSPEEREMGVVLVDIGGGTTDIAIWKNQSLIHSQIIPVGGNHFTNDLAVALKIPHSEAERIKINHGSVLKESFNQSGKVTVQGLAGTSPREVKLGGIADVLGSRAEELLALIKEIIDERNLENDINGGYVFTGGGALVKGLPDMAEYILNRPGKIGNPVSFGGMTSVMENPQYSTVLGLLLEGFRTGDGNPEPPTPVEKTNSDIVTKLSRSLKSVIKEIF